MIIFPMDSIDSLLIAIVHLRQNLSNDIEAGQVIIKNAQRRLKILNTLSSQEVATTSLFLLPEYLAKLEGCLATKIDHKMYYWSKLCSRITDSCQILLEQYSGQKFVLNVPTSDDSEQLVLPRYETRVEILDDVLFLISQLECLVSLHTCEFNMNPAVYLSQVTEDLEESMVILKSIDECLQPVKYLTQQEENDMSVLS